MVLLGLLLVPRVENGTRGNNNPICGSNLFLVYKPRRDKGPTRTVNSFIFPSIDTIKDPNISSSYAKDIGYFKVE